MDVLSAFAWLAIAVIAAEGSGVTAVALTETFKLELTELTTAGVIALFDALARAWAAFAIAVFAWAAVVAELSALTAAA